MKYFFLFFCSLPLITTAQPYALLHRQMMQPVEVTDHLERGKLMAGYFPVHTTDLNAMIQLLDQYIDSIERQHMPFLEKEWQWGHSRLLIRTSDKREEGCRVSLFTRVRDLGYTFELVHKTDSKRRALQKMKAFLYYLRNNRFLVEEKTATAAKEGR